MGEFLQIVFGLFCLAAIFLAFGAVSLGFEKVSHWWSDRGDAKREAAWLKTVDPYGPHHAVEREKYAEVLREFGGVCMERNCIMPSRRIRPGQPWHMAHDHRRGPFDYLGPAHVECNEYEAWDRDVNFDSPRTREWAVLKGIYDGAYKEEDVQDAIDVLKRKYPNMAWWKPAPPPDAEDPWAVPGGSDEPEF